MAVPLTACPATAGLLEKIHRLFVQYEESGPMRVALVLIYPCGKARNSPPQAGFSRGWTRRWAPSGPGELFSSLRQGCSKPPDATNMH